jgi:hypothetical protein
MKGVSRFLETLRGLRTDAPGTTRSRRRFLGKLLGGGAVVAGALAAPLGLSKALGSPRHGGDTAVLNYALTLEHLENAFYRDGLAVFDPSDFAPFDVGNQSAYEAFKLISSHEYDHVVTLTSAIKSLGAHPVEEAVYDFGYDTIDEFVAFAQVLENTGVMAYDGAVNSISDPALITAGATIATVEARHASYLNLINGATPFPVSFDTPKSMEDILAMVKPLIVERTPPAHQ